MKIRKRNLNDDQSFGAGFQDKKHSVLNELERAKRANHEAAIEYKRAKLASERLNKKKLEVTSDE